MPDFRSLRERAYHHLLHKLTSGELAAGSLLSEPSLARELHMSRTPIREAIRQLATEGIVESVPRYGTVVRVPNRQELAELFDIREALESYAVAQAAEATADGDLALLRRLCDEMRAVEQELRTSGRPALDASQLRRFLAADITFHLVLLRAAGNQRMAKIVADGRLFLRIFSTQRQVHDLRVLTSAHGFHRRILQAIEQHDPEHARRRMIEHIRLSKKQALASFDRRQDADATLEPIPHGLPDDLLDALGGAVLGGAPP